MTHKIYEVAEEFIVANTGEEALQDHLKRIGNWQEWYSGDELPEPEEVPFEATGMFEQEQGGYKEMTFGEYLGVDFEYKEPQLLFWRE